jgi:hypothetical protein
VRTIIWAMLALALSVTAARAQAPRSDDIPPRSTAPAPVPPFCSIPPALPPALVQQGPRTIVCATGTIVMTNSGQPCGRQLSFAPQTQLELLRRPAHGTVTLTGSAFAYIPSPGYVGPDSFVIRISGAAPTVPEWTFNVTVVTPDQAR